MNDKIALTMESNGHLLDIVDKSKYSVDLVCKGYFSNSKVKKTINVVQNKVIVNYDINEINLDYFLFCGQALPISNHKVVFKYDYFKKVDENFPYYLHLMR